MTTETNVGDLIATTHRLLAEAGLEREDGGWLGITNTWYGMVVEVSALMNGPFQCRDMLTVYITTRRGDFSLEESRDTALLLYRLVQ